MVACAVDRDRHVRGSITVGCDDSGTGGQPEGGQDQGGNGEGGGRAEVTLEELCTEACTDIDAIAEQLSSAPDPDSANCVDDCVEGGTVNPGCEETYVTLSMARPSSVASARCCLTTVVVGGHEGMGTWTIDVTTEPGVLRLKLVGRFSVEELTTWVEEHNRAVDGFGPRDYCVWADLTELMPLSQECAEVVNEAKRYSRVHPNFRGSAVLVATPMIALQQHRTSNEAGVSGTELISSDPTELREHLRSLGRQARHPGASSPDPGGSGRPGSKR